MKKTITKTIMLSILIFIVGFAVVLSWDGPEADPPTLNTSAPINVDVNPQEKEGSFRSDTDIRAPIYYDYPSTDYYLDLDDDSIVKNFFVEDIRAEIFVDWNNYAYYVNPAGASVLSGLTVSGQNVCLADGTNCPSSSDNQTLAEVLAQGNDANNLEILNVNGIRLGSASSPSSWQLYGNGNMYTSGYWRGDGGLYVGDDEYFYWNSEDFIRTGDHFQSDASVRAPLFYDSDSTSYYVNPASSSYTNQLGSFYLKNNYGVGTDHPYGIYFDSGLSTAYAIYREPGAWTSPYPDLRIAFHTGIKLGANASYNGIRFYNDYNMSTLVMSVNDVSTGGANNVYIPYTLTAGTISLGGVARTTWPATGITSETDPQVGTLYNGYWCTSNGSTVNCTSSAPSVTESDTLATVTARGNTATYVYRTYGFNGPEYDANNPVYYIDPASYSRLSQIHVDNGISTGSINASGISFFGLTYFSDVRANVFYDRDDTSYYLNPAGTSLFYQIQYYYASQVSDITLKKDIQKLDNSLDKILKLEGVSFKWKDEEHGIGDNIGLIAQDVEKIFPEVVMVNGNDGLKAIQYSSLVAPLIEAVKELSSTADKQQQQINELKEEIVNLKK